MNNIAGGGWRHKKSIGAPVLYGGTNMCCTGNCMMKWSGTTVIVVGPLDGMPRLSEILKGVSLGS